MSKRPLRDDENIARLQRVGVVPEQSHVVDTLRKAGGICHGAIRGLRSRDPPSVTAKIMDSVFMWVKVYRIRFNPSDHTDGKVIGARSFGLIPKKN